MFNKKLLLFITLSFLLIVMQSVSALTASSENYSVARFGTGVQTTNMTSSDLTGRVVSLANAGTRNAENDNLFANIGFWENTSYHVTVSITSYTIYPVSAVQGSIIKLSISALNSESVWAVLTLPSGSSETVALTNNGDAYYTASSVGIYTVTFYANNSQGNLASVIDIFEITSPVTPPSTQNGGSGGSATIIEKACTYVWDCSSWSICSNANQTRKCKNIGNCTGTEGKPIETRECSDALFDVVMTFKDIGLIPDGILRFSIDLTETKKVEKIDVQIKYSIIDNNNNEIRSQIETRAIEGNLTYKKEINEARLTDGDYVLRVEILYGNLQRAFAEETFRIRGGVIEIVEHLTNIQKIINFLRYNYQFLILVIISLILLVFFIIKKRKSRSIVRSKPFEEIQIEGNRYLEIKPKLITEIKDKSDISLGIILLKENILLKLKVFLISLWNKHQKYSANSIKGLINKKVYSDNGNYLGKIKEVILEKNRIESLKIELDKKHKLRAKGIIVQYKSVISVGEIIIIDKTVAEHLENYKDFGRNIS